MKKSGPLRKVGLHLTVAILVDATIVCALAVPATMWILGGLNWWPGGRESVSKGGGWWPAPFARRSKRPKRLLP